jgi:hypothetical protein
MMIYHLLEIIPSLLPYLRPTNLIIQFRQFQRLRYLHVIFVIEEQWFFFIAVAVIICLERG